MNLKEKRKAKQLTQYAVAERAGIARETYTNIENGVRRPSVCVAQKLGSILGFSWTEFYTESDNIAEYEPGDDAQ